MEMNWRKGGKEENWNKEKGIRKKEQKIEDEKRKEERKKEREA